MSMQPTSEHLPPPRFPFLGCAFAVSLVGNLLAGVLVLVLCFGFLLRPGDSSASARLPEKHHSGPTSASDKVAIVSLDGPIVEGLLDHVHKQIDQAAADENVKAVVLRINSPGGSITASDDLHRRVAKLKAGDTARSFPPRPLVVSMASIAASGGYYVAAPADQVFAERSTVTGSIGVYASFPNLQDLSAKVGFTMNTLKAGAIKDAGSMFREMSPQEKQVLQDTVDDAYVQFLDVVAAGRPKLTRARMLERFEVRPLQPDPKRAVENPAPYTRYRADGGVFTAVKAKDLGLVDVVGSLDDAVTAAAATANLTSFEAIRYQKQRSITDLFLGVRAPDPSRELSMLDPAALEAAFTPRIWYLAPGHEAAAMAMAARASSAR